MRLLFLTEKAKIVSGKPLPYCYSPGRTLGGEEWGTTPEEVWGLLGLNPQDSRDLRSSHGSQGLGMGAPDQVASI
jgi:hypothetical protein